MSLSSASERGGKHELKRPANACGLRDGHMILTGTSRPYQPVGSVSRHDDSSCPSRTKSDEGARRHDNVDFAVHVSFMFMQHCWIVGVAAEGGGALWEPKIKIIRSVPHGPSNGSSQIVSLVLTRVTAHDPPVIEREYTRC